jgi:PIN domain nuclease of toxin-antitoxin system
MASVAADTHSIVWFMDGDTRLSVTARTAMRASMQSGDPIFVASMSLVELTYLVEKRRLPESALRILRVALTDSSFGFRLVPLDLKVTDALAHVPRNEVPDLPDRVIAATALALKVPLVTCDGRIRAANIQTIW